MLLNGEATGFFHSKKGLIQVHQISLYLFIMKDEVLGRRIRDLRNIRKIYVIKPIGANIFSTLNQFIDDTIIVGKVLVVEVRNYLKTLQLYEAALQQKINYDKSKLFFIHTLVNQ